MRYRVTFMERTDAAGQPTESPPEYVEIDLAEGVVIDRNFVERTMPAAMHSGDSIEEEDDRYLSVASETWDYDVAEGPGERFSGRDSELTNGNGVHCSWG